MAKKKKSKKVHVNAAASRRGAFVFFVLLVIIIGTGLGVYFLLMKGPLKPSGSSSEPSSSEPVSSEIHSYEYSSELANVDKMVINFLELGNYHTGDCTFIKAGDVDILIDAGSIQSSAKTIKEYVDKYCHDGILDYVIATHAHQDHIAGFVGTQKEEGIFDHYQIGTLIEFAITNTNSKIYKSYVEKRNVNIISGNIKEHYTAAQCIKGENGAKQEYTIANGVQMKILDQKYYYDYSSDENNYSVCVLFTQGNNNYLFTGDLEAEGEASLVEKNTLPHVQLFKGGHHGSYTANTDTLLSAITPENVCICCCAGNDEYTPVVANQFPAQVAINNIAKYTANIYVTTVSTDGHTGYQSMNGNITFVCNKGADYYISGSNNSIILKETDWFKNNREWPEGGK